MLKYKNHRFGVFLGPQIGVLISAKAKPGGESKDFKDQLKSTDFSGIIGASCTLSNGFDPDARYQLGFGNIVRGTEEGPLNNNGLIVDFHYFFNQGER